MSSTSWRCTKLTMVDIPLPGHRRLLATRPDPQQVDIQGGDRVSGSPSQDVILMFNLQGRGAMNRRFKCNLNNWKHGSWLQGCLILRTMLPIDHITAR